MKLKLFILTMFALITLGAGNAYAQVDKKDVRSGNRDFRKENYKEADIDYRKALVKDSTSLAANYNLASTLYRMGEQDPQSSALPQAKESLDRIAENVAGSKYVADYNFNRGDVALAMKDYQTAVDAFKASLLANPGDIQAKENYIYAKKMLENQQNQQNQDQNQDQNKDQNQDQNQDQNNDQNQDKNDDKNNDQNKDQNQNQDKNNDNKDQNQNQQPQQGEQPKITPQAAQQMLKAIQAKEAQTQDKVNKEKAEALKARQKEKNW